MDWFTRIKLLILIERQLDKAKEYFWTSNPKPSWPYTIKTFYILGQFDFAYKGKPLDLPVSLIHWRPRNLWTVNVNWALTRYFGKSQQRAEKYFNKLYKEASRKYGTTESEENSPKHFMCKDYDP